MTNGRVPEDCEAKQHSEKKENIISECITGGDVIGFMEGKWKYKILLKVEEQWWGISKAVSSSSVI